MISWYEIDYHICGIKKDMLVSFERCKTTPHHSTSLSHGPVINYEGGGGGGGGVCVGRDTK